jgi:hypothetical protein
LECQPPGLTVKRRLHPDHRASDRTDAPDDEGVRANPLPCARATYEAEQTHQLYPRCYADAELRQQAGTITAIPVFRVVH